MKFIALVALIAVVKAEVGADCSEEGSAGVCDDTECCGWATPDEENGSSAEEKLMICQTDSLAEYIDASDEEATYTFACATEGAMKLMATASLAVASAYLM